MLFIRPLVGVALIFATTLASATVLTINIKNDTENWVVPAHSSPDGICNYSYNKEKIQIICKKDENDVLNEEVILASKYGRILAVLTSTPYQNGQNFQDMDSRNFDRIENRWHNYHLRWSEHYWDGRSDLTLDAIFSED